ncbi:hypothetical protein, partial [Geobacillus stearothermophilus]|uniref:hypothetical protein n=1 Tax=Geobacillus stearothermophilus TaxID=1422 RepID=UPI002402D60E
MQQKPFRSLAHRNANAAFIGYRAQRNRTDRRQKQPTTIKKTRAQRRVPSVQRVCTMASSPRRSKEPMMRVGSTEMSRSNGMFIVFGEETPTSTTKGSKWGRNRFFCFCITKKYDITYDI